MKICDYLIALVLVSVMLVSGCASKSKGAPEEAPATPVEVAIATTVTMHHVVSGEAVLFPFDQASIVPKISAPVRSFLVHRGDHVKRGQLIAVLEDRDLLATTVESRELYQQAQANLDNTRLAAMPDDLTKASADLASAQEGMQAAQTLYNNRVVLLKEGAVAQKLVDDAKVALVQSQSLLETANQHLKSLQTVGQPAQLKSAEAQTNAAKAHYESSAAQSSYGEVRSPISGIVADRGVNVGDVASSSSSLATIVDVSRIVAHLNLAVNEALLLHRGQAATIHSPTGDVEGKVTVVSPAVDANTTTIQVWVEAANPKEVLKLGSTVEVTIEAGDIPNAISVPASALLSSDEGGEKVMVALANGTAQERKVKVGVHNGDDVQLLSGVKQGEKVIVSNALGLDDKAKIEVEKPSGKAESAAAGDDK